MVTNYALSRPPHMCRALKPFFFCLFRALRERLERVRLSVYETGLFAIRSRFSDVMT